MDSVTLKARAKINLGLDVIRRRPDGYHDVKMIMQSINLYDVLRIKKCEKPEIMLAANKPYIPVNEDNLIYKAAKLMMDEYGIGQGVSIELDKFIPVAAGMAGGSTDAAATMIGMNRLFELKVPKKELMKLSVKIGADVPFCIMRGTVLAEGIGDRLTRLKPMPSCPIVIAKPGINVSTKFVYENLKLDETTRHPDIDGIVQSIAKGDIDGVCSRLGNVLETVTVKEYPVIQELKEKMLDMGAINSLMSGSGPTVFGIFKSFDDAKACCDCLRSSHMAKQVYVTDVFGG